MQNNLKGGDYKMDNKTVNPNSNQKNNSLNATHDSSPSNSNKYKNVEPLPESFRPRRDGPGGEDGE